MAAPAMAERATVHLDDDFFQSVVALDPGYARRVIESVELLRNNPEHPNLKLKRLSRELDHLWSIRAGRDVRVLLHRRGDTFVAIEAGLRRDIYAKAERGRFVVNPARRFIGFVDADTPVEQRRQPIPLGNQRHVSDAPGVFDHWTDKELSEAGFEQAEVDTLRSLADEYGLLELGWPEERLDLAMELVEMTPEAWRSRHEETGEQRIRRAIAEFGGLTGISPDLSDDALRRLAEAPIEDWMVFLHPDQQALVDAEFRGPARVRGAAGTGKTVVALHRAASLARRFDGDSSTGPRPVLLTTVVPALSDVLEGLYGRLPQRVEGRVDFLALDDVALAVCERNGVSLTVDVDAVDAAWLAAWGSLTDDDPLRASGLTSAYVRTEIEKVLKGRDLRSETEYLSVVRTGRRCGLARSTRSSVWALNRRWDQEMKRRGTVSGPDAVNRALALLEGATEPWYRAVVVDEAQDLTLAGLQLLRRLVNGSGRDRSDGLFLVGDGAQRIQPGGFTLRQAGVEVRGRTTVLRVNYRNTAEIIGAALAALGDQNVADLDEEFRRGEQSPVAIRSGEKPRLSVAADHKSEVDAVVSWVEEVAATRQVATGDVAVLLPTQAQADTWRAELSDRKLASDDLAHYGGRTSERVKVGTHAQAKGLEFKVVVVPELGAEQFPPPPADDETTEETEERVALVLSHLFVAMTRARDLLVLTTTGEPSVWLDGVAVPED